MARPYNMALRAESVAATRENILAAVRDELVEVGTESLTLADVAARAGVSLRTLYNHASSRSELLRIALLGLVDTITEASIAAHDMTDAAHDGLAAHDPRAAVTRLVAGVFDTFAEQRDVFVALLAAAHDPEFAEAISESRMTGYRRVGEILAPASEAGMLRRSLAETQAIASVAILFSSWQHLTEDIGMAPDAATDFVAKTLVTTLFVDEGRRTTN